VLESVEARHRATAEAVRKFVESLDAAIPNLAPSLRKTILDAALELADQLVTVQVEFVRSVVRSATGTLKQGDAKPAAD
jgi:flagellar biosynthesis/type III secretory pathway protein FliH